jgi:hypothetical protein
MVRFAKLQSNKPEILIKLSVFFIIMSLIILIVIEMRFAVRFASN